MTTSTETTNVEDIDWSALDKLKRGDLQRLCKEFSLPLKATSKNAEILEALRQFKKEYDEKKEKEEEEKKNNNKIQQQSTNQQEIKNIVNRNNIDTTTTSTTIINEQESNIEMKDDEKKEEEGDDEVEEENEQIQPREEEVESQQHLLDTLPIPEKNEMDMMTTKPIHNQQQSKKRYEEELNDADDNDNQQDVADIQEQLEHEEMERKINHPGLKFRNYIPRDSSLLPYRLPKSKVPPIVEELMSRLKVLEESGLDNSSLLPRKVNWDLKRDLEKKLNKLEKRTNVSIYQLIKQSILANNNNNNNNINNIDEGSMKLLTRTVDKLK